MIRLERLTKRYPGQSDCAVDDFSLDIPAGETVVLVGPSGCGKTTTLRLINRLIEPTSGRIVLDGEDVTRINGDELRRRIGYVIQQVGLFPHMTIAENIAVVPRMLGWRKSRIDDRADELLTLVGMDPALYRARYPRELSGGQAQRVGVARAMAADPPVLLMDEPFGAIDPITRERLQNEFLRLKESIRKTVVFITHDIDEAIKMGDRIAILREGSKVAQYDTPDRILNSPADSFCEQFIGSGAVLKGLQLKTISNVGLSAWPVATHTDSAAEVREMLRATDKGFALMLDADGYPRRWVSAHDLESTDGSVAHDKTEVVASISHRATLHDALNEMLSLSTTAVAVVDDSGRYCGTLDLDTIMLSVESLRSDARARARRPLADAPPATT